MNAQCPFCLEELGMQNTPVSMPCGHMYCLDCATFWFNQDDSPQKCTCGRMFKGGDIIRLWTSSEPSASSSGTGSAHNLQGKEALAACSAVVDELEQGQQDWGLASALTKTQQFLDSVSRTDQTVGIQNLLKSIRTLLQDIKTRNALIEQPTDNDRLRAATSEIRQIKAKMDRDIQEIYQQNLMQEESARREQEENKQKEQDLTQRLQDLRRALDTARRHLEETKIGEATFRIEVDKLRRSELRYKKKYYALKQDVEAAKKSVRGKSVEAEDDSLVIF